MKNTFGNAVSVTLFGESHGKEIGAVLDGLCPGIPVDEEEIRFRLDLHAETGDRRLFDRQRDLRGEDDGNAALHPDPEPFRKKRGL